MKHLVFDIECSFKSQDDSNICSIGYIIANDDFKIIKKERIWIKPEKTEERLIDMLKLDMDKLNKSPSFENIYPVMMDIFSQEDCIIFAFSAEHDLRYIIRDCRRSNLKYPRINVYDIQKIYCAHAGETGKPPLAKISEWTGKKYNQHDPIEDSMAELAILEKICRERKKSIIKTIASLERDVTVSAKNVSSDMLKDPDRQKLKNMIESQEKIRKTATTRKLAGKRFLIPEIMGDVNVDLGLRIVETILSNSGTIVESAKECDYFITDHSKDTVRSGSVDHQIKQKKRKIKKISFSDLNTLCN